MPPKKPQRSARFVQLTAKKAKEILGWRLAKEKEKDRIYKVDGEKVCFDNNNTNRPFSASLAARYAKTMLLGMWQDNGESMTIDSAGSIISCAHRCVGLVIAENMRLRYIAMGKTEELEKHGLNQDPKKELTIPILLVMGIDPTAADSTDTGKTRTLGDVLFRRHEFKGKQISDSNKVKLSKELATAIRIVWLRIRGERIARGSKLLHPEALAFLEDHPRLHDAVLHIWECDGGKGTDGKKISQYVSIGCAAAMLYLAEYSAAEVQGADVSKSMADFKNPGEQVESAKDFWSLFAEDLHAKDNAIRGLHKALEKNCSSETKLPRDAVCTLITRAWMNHTGASEKWGDTRKLAARLFAKVDDKEVLNFERFGGIDLEKEVLTQLGWLQSATVKRTATGTWKLKDLCWVNQPDTDPWYGEITGFSDDGLECIVLCKDDSEEYRSEISWLCTDKPEDEDEDSSELAF